MSFIETGHAQNAAKFKVIIVKVTALGATYNPSKVAIKLLGLNTVSTNADASILAVDNALTPWQNAINAREIAFLPLSARTTRIINALKATDASAQTIKDAIFLEKKIHGPRITPKTPAVNPPDPNAPVNISASQMQFDSRIENFGKLLILLGAEPLYVPNEDDLKLAGAPGLTAYLATLVSTNTDAVATAETLLQARKTRNIVLYKDGSGLFDIQRAVRRYIRSLPSQRLLSHELALIRFTRPKKKDRPS